MLWIAVFTVLLLPKCILAQISETIILQNDEPVAITSPNYPNYYGNFEDKLWKIVAPDGYRIRLDFTYFNTEEWSDFVIIYDGTSGSFDEATDRAIFSGNSLPRNVTSASRYMWIRFTSDQNNQFQGFRAIAYAVASDEMVILQNDETVEITSPNYPNYYGENENKLWKIMAPVGYRIGLRFTDFEIEEGYDFVIIYDGTSGSFDKATERARFSGNSLPLNVTSASRYMWIWFTSDRNNQFQGFRAIAYAVAPASTSTLNDITTLIGSSDEPTQVPESTSTINDDTTPSGSSDVPTKEQASTSTINDITTPSGSLDMPIQEQVKTESNLMIILTSTLTPLLTIALLMVILCGALRRKRLKERTYHLKPAPDAKENHGTRDNPAFQSPDDFGGEDSYMALTTSQEDPSSKLYQTINKINNQTDGNEVPIDDVHGTTDAEYVTLQDLPASLKSGYEITHVCEDSSGTVDGRSGPQ